MVADDVGPVPLVLLFHRAQQVHGVAVVVVVTAEEPALSARRLCADEDRLKKCFYAKDND